MKLFIQRKRKAGYSLLEVMISLLLVAYIGVVFTASFPVASQGSKAVGNYAQAISIAQHKIDQLRVVGYGRLNYDELSNAGIIDGYPTGNPYSFVDSDNLLDVFPGAEATITISFLSDSIAQATVEMTWTGARHTGGQLRIDGLITKG